MVKNPRFLPKNVIDSLPDLFLVIDAQTWHVRYVNDAMAQSLNLTKKDLIGKNILKILPPKVAQLRKQQGEKVIKTKEPVYFEDERDGRWFDNTFYPVLDTDGTVIAGAVVVREITKSKLETLKKLADQEKYYCSLIEQSTDLISVIDPQGIIRFVSPSITKILGYQLDEIISKPMISLLHKNEIQKLQKILEKIITNSIPEYRIEHRILHKNGKWVQVETIANNQMHNSQIKGIIINTRDITERKQAEQALQESEKKYRELIDNINDGVFIMDAQGKVTYVNKIIEKRSGMPSEKWYTLHLYDNVDPESREESIKKMKQIKKGADLPPYEIAYKNQNGKIIYVEINIKPIIKNNIIVGAQGTTRDITERKQYEQKLEASEQKYRELVENIKDGICTLDKHGYFLYVNDVIINRSELSLEKFRQITFYDLILPEYHEILRKKVKKLLKGEYITPFEVAYKNTSGKKIYVEINARLQKNDRGEMFIHGITRDVTERKKVQEKLRESEEKYRSIFNTSVGALITTDINGTITNVNPAALQILGYDNPQELIGRSTLEGYAYPEQRDLLMQQLRKTGNVHNYEITFLRKDGSHVHCIGILGYTFDKEGKINGTIGSFQDITEKAKAEQEIKQTRDYLQSVINSSHDIIFTVDVKNRILTWNKTAEIISGYTEKNLKGKNILAVNVFVNNEELKNIIQDTFKGKPQKTNEISLMTIDGSHRLLRFSTSLMKGDHREPVALLFTMYDITEESTLQHQMKWGKGYLCVDIDPHVSTTMIQNFLRENKQILLLFRGSLSELHKFEHHPNLTITMLSNERFSGSTNLLTPQDVENAIKAFLQKQSDPVVVIKRIDYLISTYGFDETLKMLYRVHEYIRQYHGLLCIHISKACIEPASLALLQQEFSVFFVSDIENIQLSEEIHTILQTISKLSNIEEMISFRLLQKHCIGSSPTVKRIVDDLRLRGLVSVRSVGRQNVIHLTNRGKNFLLKQNKHI